MTTPNLGMPEVPSSNSLQPSVPVNDSLQIIDALVQLSVETITATPPTTVSGDVGKRWIVDTGATGAWLGKDGSIALCTAADTWRFFTPLEGWRADVRDENSAYRFDGSAWVVIAAASAPYDIIVAIGDETTEIAIGVAKVTIRAPRAMTLTQIKGSLATAGSTSSAFDVNKNGVSLFSTTLTIDASEKTSASAATPAVLASTAIAADDELTFDIDTAGTGAKGAKITLVGTAS